MDRQNNQTTRQVDRRKVFRYLKTSRTDQQGIPPLRQNENLHIISKYKADILNQKCQCVHTLGTTFSKRTFSHESARPCG